MQVRVYGYVLYCVLAGACAGENAAMHKSIYTRLHSKIRYQGANFKSELYFLGHVACPFVLLPPRAGRSMIPRGREEGLRGVSRKRCKMGSPSWFPGRAVR